jgi:hypothetical protein
LPLMKDTYRNTRTRTTPSKRNISKLKMTGVISSILLLSLAIFSATAGKSVVLAQQQQQSMSMMSSSALPQPNANGTLLKANGSKALFEPAE